jgi:hypothetical protein
MPARMIFRCDVCGREADGDAYRSLMSQLQDLRFGEYSDADDWLVWHGRGIYGPARYACGEHRIALRDYLRKHYGTLGWHPHARVLGDVPREVREQMAEPRPKGRRATERQRALLRQYRGSHLI